MVIQTFIFLLQAKVNWHFAGFVFFSTLCSYSFHWYLTNHSAIPSPRIDWLKKYRITHVILFIIGAAGSAIFFYYLLPYWFWLIVSAVITFLYSAPKIPHPYFRALRKVALGKTIFLAFVWMYVTTILPVIVAGNNWNGGITLFTLSRFFLIYSICILFDYRDRADDKAAGIRSMITYFSEKNIRNLFILSLLLFALFTISMLRYGYQPDEIILLLIPGIVVAALFNYARRNFDDMFYYFVLDGLMALSALLMLVFNYF